VRADGSERRSPFDGLTVLADDDPRWSRDPIALAAAATEGGAALVQLRAKRATDRETLAWAAAIRTLTRRHAALFCVNDRFDLALAAGADGVHLGQDDLPPDAIPEAWRLGSDRLFVGRSTHNLEQALAAAREPIDYVAFGPIFGTTSKDSPHPARGLARLTEVVRGVAPLPVVAIGGIDARNAAGVLDAGARGVAVIGAVAGASDPLAATRELVGVLDRARAA